MILDCDYTVRFAPFPLSVPALTAKDEDGHYNIYINCNLSDGMQKQALKHELEHIKQGDFESQEPLEIIEPYRPVSKPQEEVVVVAVHPPRKMINFSIVDALTGKAEKIKIEKRRYPCIDIWADELDRPPRLRKT